MPTATSEGSKVKRLYATRLRICFRIESAIEICFVREVWERSRLRNQKEGAPELRERRQCREISRPSSVLGKASESNERLGANTVHRYICYLVYRGIELHHNS